MNRQEIKDIYFPNDTVHHPVLADVGAERIRQEKLWGHQRHELGKWLGILGEEFGEVCQAINGMHFPKDAKTTDSDNLYTELIHLAAVSVAIAEQVKEWEQVVQQNKCDVCLGTGKSSYGPELGQEHTCGRCNGTGRQDNGY